MRDISPRSLTSHPTTRGTHSATTRWSRGERSAALAAETGSAFPPSGGSFDVRFVNVAPVPGWAHGGGEHLLRPRNAVRAGRPAARPSKGRSKDQGTDVGRCQPTGLQGPGTTHCLATPLQEGSELVRVGPPPARRAEPVHYHVNIAGNPPHRQLGHCGGISRGHRLAAQFLPHRDVLTTLVPGSQRSHAIIMPARFGSPAAAPGRFLA